MRSRIAYRILERLRGGQERAWPSSFADRLTHPVPGPQAVLRLYKERGMKPDLTDAARIPVRVAESLPALAAGAADVTWIGHATCVVRLGGLTVLTDPVWSRTITGVRPRLTPPGVPLEALPHIDAVVISHNHFDHLDAPTIRRLRRDVPMLVPGGLGWWMRRLGFTAVVELDWWESVTVAGVSFAFVPAHHWSRRTLFDTNKSLWGGWLLSDGSATVYFGGDSAYGRSFAEIGERYPGIDVALLPVGAYLPRWFMKPLHMSPEEAVRACGDLGARRMVPVHWGTFVLSKETPLEPLERSRKAWADAGRDPVELWDLAVGETRVI